MPDAMHPAVSVIHHIQQQTAYQTAHRDNGFQHRPGFDGLADSQVKVLFEQPEARIVHVRENHTTGTNRNNHQLRANTRRCNQRCRDTTRSDCRNGCGTQRDTQYGSNRPGHQQRRNVGFVHHGSNVFVHAAVYQHLLERTATTDNQQHHRNDFDGRNQRVVNLIH